MKKILLVSHKMNLGGTEKALLALINSLKDYDLDITLLLLEKGGALEDSIPGFVKVKYFDDFEAIKPIIENPPLHTITKYFKKCQIGKGFGMLKTYINIKASGNWYHIYEHILKKTPKFGDYDIAVAFAGPSDFITYFIAEKIQAPRKIQWIHFDIEKIISNFSFGKKYYSFYNKIFCVSNSSRNIFAKYFPEYEKKTEVFPNIISDAELQKLASQGESYIDNYNGIRILTVARFTKEKGQHLVPDVVLKLKNEGYNFRWYFVGDGIEKNNVMKDVQSQGISENFIFLGEKLNPYPYMKDCDIYMQPSIHEGFGITVVEAKIFKKPVVITNFASAKDLIRHDKDGLIVDISSGGIYKGVKKMLQSSKLREDLSKSLYKPNTENLIDKILQ